MNKVILIGRLTRDPDIRWTQGEEQSCVAHYTLAVDRKYKKEGGKTADFPACVAFGRQAEFAEKYLAKGIKIAVTGRLQTGSYTNRDGVKVYTTDVIVDEQEFVESKAASDQHRQESQNDQQNREDYQNRPQPAEGPAGDDGFMKIPDNIDEELPWN